MCKLMLKMAKTSLTAMIMMMMMTNLSHSLELGQCRSALGMQTDDIPDEAISVSSSIDPINYGAVSARIRKEIKGGAWCPSLPISRDVYEFLQIDLGELKVLTLVETQGRFNNGQGQEYVEQYRLEYQREDNKAWKLFKNRRGQEILQGNSNTYLAELKELDPPIIARRIRFVPYSLQPKQVCLRVELYGCTWKDGTLSYDMPQGERRSNDVELNDDTYDGDRKNGHLFDGLGQLTDGELGGDSLRHDPRGTGVKGYEWVGWRNDSLAATPHRAGVELLFRFDRVRNFSAALLHCFNNARDVRVFRSATFIFSLGDRCRSRGAAAASSSSAPAAVAGGRYLDSKEGEDDYGSPEGLLPGTSASGLFQPPLVFRPSRDQPNDQRRMVSVPLENRIGDCVTVRLEFDSRWILLSEVQFNSEYANETVVSHLLSLQTPAKTDRGSVGEDVRTGSDLPEDSEGGGGRRTPGSSDAGGAVSKSSTGLSEEQVGAVVGTLCTTTILLLIVGLVCYARRRGRSKYVHRVMKCETNPGSGARGALASQTIDRSARGFGDPLFSPVPSSCDPEKSNGSPFDAQGDFTSPGYSLGGGGGGAGGDFFTGIGSATAVKGRRLPEPPIGVTVKSQGHPGHLQTVLPTHHHQTHHHQQQHHQQQQQQQQQQQHQQQHHQQQQRFPVTLRASLMRKFNQNHQTRESAAGVNPCVAGQRSLTDESTAVVPPSTSSDYSTIMSDSTASNQYSANQPQHHYAVLDSDWPAPSNACTAGYNTSTTSGHVELPRRRLKFIEKLGEGSFGEVYVCEVLQSSFAFSYTDDGRRHSVLGLAKTFPMKRDPMNRLNFEAEVQKSSRLNDPNLVQLLGVVSADDPWLVLTEFTKYGDLRRFLEAHSLEGSPGQSDHGRQGSLTYGSLIFMASQIASGMKHMEQLNLVHGDLASRNCLVDEGLRVKVSDLELTKSGPYAGDYCSLPGRSELLPIRWMAWEALVMSRYSTKSDVWSFGITMWEILTMAEELPLSALDDEEVVENMECLARREELPAAATAAAATATAGAAALEGAVNAGSGAVFGGTIVPRQPPICPREIYDLMKECWNRDAGLRPTFREIHMFLQRKNLGFNPREEKLPPPPPPPPAACEFHVAVGPYASSAVAANSRATSVVQTAVV